MFFTCKNFFSSALLLRARVLVCRCRRGVCLQSQSRTIDELWQLFRRSFIEIFIVCRFTDTRISTPKETVFHSNSDSQYQTKQRRL